MCSKLGFSKGHDISLQDLSHSSSAQQPSKTGKNATVRTTQRTHGVSTYKLHCAAKTAKFFLARKLTAKQVQNMQNMLKATPTMWQLLQTMQVQNNVLPTKSQNMHLRTRAQNRGSHRNQIFTPPHDRSVSSGPGSLSPQRQRLAALKRNRPNSSG